GGGGRGGGRRRGQARGGCPPRGAAGRGPRLDASPGGRRTVSRPTRTAGRRRGHRRGRGCRSCREVHPGGALVTRAPCPGGGRHGSGTVLSPTRARCGVRL